MEEIDEILDFVVYLGREMLESGANLERVNLSIELICKAYQLREVSVISTSTSISVGARVMGEPAKVRQTTVTGNEIHLERLCRLNDLSYKVCQEKPKPADLENMLYEAMMVPKYESPVLLVGYLLAMACLCRIFNGNWQEILVAEINTVILFFLTDKIAKQKLNRIISNVICMFVAGIIATFSQYIGLTHDFYPIIITNAFYLIPGIPMVNAVRNILCGNEMNGIIELIKVILEVATIDVGLYLAYLVAAGLAWV